MVKKLQYLNKPVNWEHVMELVGDGGAPGRPHVARALLEAGHVQSLQHAYKKYLHDGGPAYASGDEIPAEEVVHLICHTGGVAALAHPWTLKNPRPLVRRLKAAGLHAMEAHKSSGKISEFTQMAEEFNLLKLGGSDYHGTGAPNEVDLGKVLLPAKVFCEFLKLAQPIWSAALKSMVHDYANSSISQQSASMIIEELSSHTAHFCSRKSSLSCGCVSTDKNSGIHGILKFSQWLRKEDRELLMAEASNLGLKYSSSIDLSGRATIVLFGTWQEVKVAHYS
ncbi:hypothetical protein O6H91_12G051400 [Diphasiastrum complanatum]|nr:hypothetical protein O6H91_12G051400 [Diphasiastrum complanatum]